MQVLVSHKHQLLSGDQLHDRVEYIVCMPGVTRANRVSHPQLARGESIMHELDLFRNIAHSKKREWVGGCYLVCPSCNCVSDCA